MLQKGYIARSSPRTCARTSQTAVVFTAGKFLTTKADTASSSATDRTTRLPSHQTALSTITTPTGDRTGGSNHRRHTALLHHSPRTLDGKYQRVTKVRPKHGKVPKSTVPYRAAASFSWPTPASATSCAVARGTCLRPLWSISGKRNIIDIPLAEWPSCDGLDCRVWRLTLIID